MPKLQILTPGTWTLPVDAGRPGSRCHGVPLGGPADRRSLILGNALLSNPPFTPALEIALSGPSLVTDANVAMVVVGASFALEAAGLSLRANKSFTLPAGVTLSILGTGQGARGYCCVAGGITPIDRRRSLSAVRGGETFTVSASATLPRHAALPLRIPHPDEIPLLRVLPGSHMGGGYLAGVVYTLSPQSNRMGLRLLGPPIPLPALELTSEPVCPGTVQVPRDGQPILLGVDCQTIGGYPRLAQVIRADLDLTGQLRPGMRVGFRVVTLAEAEAADRADREELRRWELRLRTMATLPLESAGQGSSATAYRE